MAEFWHLLTIVGYLVSAAGALALAIWLLPKERRQEGAVPAIIFSLIVSAAWAISVVAVGGLAPAPQGLLSFSYLAWLWTLYRLFTRGERVKGIGPLRPVLAALAFVEMLQLPLVFVFRDIPVSELPVLAFVSITAMRLLVCVGALVLLHNLYAGTTATEYSVLRWPAAALALMWLYDLNLYTVAYLAESVPLTLAALRSVMLLLMVLLLAFGQFHRGTEYRLRPSRSFAFQSLSLALIGGYFLAMLFIARALSFVGGDFARLVQAVFVAGASAAALLMLPSRRLRGWLRLTLARNLFQHRYDYRTEWLRFTETIGRSGMNNASLRERAIQTLADITDSASGVLFARCSDDDGLVLEARWQWNNLDVPAEALPMECVRFFEEQHVIIALDKVREGKGRAIPDDVVPEWLMATRDVWALIPLHHFNRLIGVVALGRPPIRRVLDWEDFDLLRIVSYQLASYLAEEMSQDALGEAQRFDDFNRRIAFVMHDVKNLASQLSLLARNAEKHADKPEFRADMLVTLRNSTDKLNMLLARLNRYGSHVREEIVDVSLTDLLNTIVRRFKNQHEIILIERENYRVLADPAALEQSLVHLVQNAVDASAAAAPVFLDARCDGDKILFEIIDSGCGMSTEFIRTQLFKPFRSSKPGGFGIGAFEAREMIQAMGGHISVESREGMGSRFMIHLPLAQSELGSALNNNPNEVA